jgi:protease-4
MSEPLLTPAWEQKTIEKLVFETLKEQKRKRRWGIFFKVLLFGYLFAMLYLIWPDNDLSGASLTKKHVALIHIDGVIADNNEGDADNVIEALQSAYKDKNTKSVILSINSPGGSPVQASQIYNEVRYLQAKHKNIKVYAVCSDLCASAAYFIASSADYIYANPASLVGSIGVLMDGFGFVDTMQKVGVQRRLITSGSHKGFLDPFSPIKPDDAQFAQDLLDNVHQQFIQKVIQGRGDRLKTNTPNLFSGLVWTGDQALPIGLIDGFGDVTSVSRDILKSEDVVDYTIKPNLLDQVSSKLGADFTHSIASQFNLNFAGLKE